jgi:hypothetical protein
MSNVPGINSVFLSMPEILPDPPIACLWIGPQKVGTHLTEDLFPGG